MTTPLDSATPIYYKTGIFRQSECIFYSFLHFFLRNPPYFCFRSAWPNFLKSGSRDALVKWIPSTKFEIDPTIRYSYSYSYRVTLFNKLFSEESCSVIVLWRYRDMTPLPQIRYVTLWPWRLTFWPWTVLENFLSCDLTFHQIWASQDHPFLSYDVHTLTAIGNTNSLLAIAHAQYHVTYLQGVDISHIFEPVTPICLFTLQLLWRYDAD